MPDNYYTFTPNAFGQPSIISANPEGLAVIARAELRSIPWAEVREVRLSFDPTRFDRDRFLCRLFPKTGTPITICSTTCNGPGRFELQAAAYRQILREIHRHLTAQPGRVAFTAGVGRLRYLLNIAFLTASMMVLVPILVMVGAAYLGPLVIVELIVIAAALPWAWKWIRSNRPTPYDPAALPESLLPKEPPAGNAPAIPSTQPPPLPAHASSPPPLPSHSCGSQTPAVAPASVEPLPPRRPKPTIDDYGPIAEPGDPSWCSVGGNTTHWADAERYLAEDLAKWEQEEQARAEAGVTKTESNQTGTAT